ncbi:hypothetical protein ABPG74_005396 [Tetrahymena malaccensis]
MKKLFYFIAVFLQFYCCQKLFECQDKGTYYDLFNQNCGYCNQYCDSCDGVYNCLNCQNRYFYNQENGTCVDSCYANQYQSEFFQQCIECKIENCKLCSFQDGLCQQCNDGWKLSKDQLYCYKDECLSQGNSYYESLTGQCTTTCPENTDQKLGMCTNLRKFSQIEIIGSRTKIMQQSIDYLLYFDQINANTMVFKFKKFYYSCQINYYKQVVALNNSTATFYSYETLIPHNQIRLFNSYQSVIQQNQYIFLLSQQNIQKIDVENQIIQIIYSFSIGDSFYYTETSIVINLMDSIKIINFSSNESTTYQILNTNNLNFSPLILSQNNTSNQNQQDTNSVQSNIQLQQDSEGCFFINESSIQQVIINQQNTNQTYFRMHQDFQLYFEQMQGQLSQTFNNYQSDDMAVILSTISNQQILIFDFNTLSLLTISIYQDNLSILEVFEYENKLRFVFMNSDYYQGVFQSVIICFNLTLDKTSSSYFLEYDEPHFAQSTQQIIEYHIFGNYSSLIIASKSGYEIINISPSQSQVETNSSQNVFYMFSSIQNYQIYHLKFLNETTSLILKSTQDSLFISFLNFNSSGFSINNKQIQLNILNYSQLSLNINQILNIDEDTILMAYKNSIQKISFISKDNDNQAIQYSSFSDSDNTYYLNGIFKILYSNDTNSMIIIFKTGFRVIYLNGQKPVFEKNLKSYVFDAEIISQLTVITYLQNDSYDFLIVNLTNRQVFSYEKNKNITYISLIKEKDQSILYVAAYYQNSLQLFCIQSQNIDVFFISATAQIIAQSYSNVIQVLENNIYINTKEYYILVFKYDQILKVLQQIDNIYTLQNYFVVDSNNILVVNTCQNYLWYCIFNRVNRTNYQLSEALIRQGVDYFRNVYFSSQYQKVLLSLNKNGLMVFDLNAYQEKSIFQNFISSDQQSFLTSQTNQNQAYTLYDYLDLSNTTLVFPFSSYISTEYQNFYQIFNSTFLIIQNALNEQYLYDLYKQETVQFLLINTQDTQLCLVQQNIVAIYNQENLSIQYVLNQKGLVFPDQGLSYADFTFWDETSYFVIFGNQSLYLNLKNFEFQNITKKVDVNVALYPELSEYIGESQEFLSINDKNQFVIVDFQYNILNIFINQTQVVYLREIDSFLALDLNNQVSLYRRKDYKKQLINLFLESQNCILGYSAVALQQGLLQVFDLNLNLTCQHIFIGSLFSKHLSSFGQFAIVNQNDLILVNYTDCSLKNTALQGLYFQTADLRQMPIFIFLDGDLDTITLISQNKLNLFQFSTLKYLGSLDYNSYCINCQVLYIPLTNSLAIQQANFQFQVFDLWTPVFNTLNQNALRQYRNRFLYNSESSTYLYFDYNTGVINTYSSDSLTIVHQFKLQDSQLETRYFVQFFKINYSTILTILSSQELAVYDFIQNKQIYYSSSSFDCILYSNFTQDIYCLEANNVLKKFNYTALDFQVVANQNQIDIQVNEFYALSKQIIVFIDYEASMKFLDIQTFQASSIIMTKQQYLNKIEQVGEFIVASFQKQYLSVYQLNQIQGIKNITETFQYNKEGLQIQDFLIINYNMSYTLLMANQLQIQIFNMQSQQFIGDLPISCQNQFKFKQDDDFLYCICSFQVNIFQKRVLKLINYYKINQFSYSNLKDVQYVYQDFYLLTLANELLLIKLNQSEASLVESFQNLNNPSVYLINLKYENNQLNIVSQIIFKCYSDSNIFDITYQVSENNIQTNDTLLTFIQSQSSLNQTNQHKSLQSRVYSQKNLKLAKYVLQMTIENSNLPQVEIFYNIFTETTIIQYQFQINQNQKSQIGIANLTDNFFILPQFSHLVFSSIKLYLALSQSDFNFNRYQNIQTINFKDVEIIFNQNSSSFLQISNLDQLVLDSFVIQNQKIDGLFNSMIVNNVTNILVINMTIQNVQIIHQPLIQFLQISNITILELNLFNIQLANNILSFVDCQNIQIQNIKIQSLSIYQGNIFQIIMSNTIQLADLIATDIKRINQTQQVNNQNLVLRMIQNVNYNDYISIVNIQGCQTIKMNKIMIDNLNNVGVILAIYYQLGTELEYYNKYIEITNTNITNVNFEVQEILFLQSIQGLLQNLNIYDIISAQNAITLNIQQQITIQDSYFENIFFRGGSVINMLNGILVLNSSSFQNINSIGFPCALNVLQANTISILKTNFTNLANLKNEEVQFNQNSQGGAIKLQNTIFASVIQSIFQNCSAYLQGGAIYSQQIQSSTLLIQNSDFIENESIQNSGGALFLSQLTEIKVSQSYFTKNKANVSRGGAIYLESCNLKQFEQINFSFNQADIGGSIFYMYTPKLLLNHNAFVQNKVQFLHNKASFYGQNIGSFPVSIGISQRPSLDQLKVYSEYQVNNIASGNYLDETLYLNFIDEESNALNFLGSSVSSERNAFYFLLNYSQNNDIIIQQGITAQLNKTIGLFELNFQSLYKISQNQTIYLVSNQFQNGNYLSLSLNLHYRNCVKGEIILENNQFIQCNKCVQGRYSLKKPDMDVDINQIQCSSCPSGAYFCQGSEIKLKDGYWRENDETDQIYSCLLESCSFDNIVSKHGCLPGYVGPLCNSCDSKKLVWQEQYGMKNMNCYPCQQQWIGQLCYFTFFLLLNFCYLAYSHYNISQNKVKYIKLILFKKIGLLMTNKLSASGNDISLWFKLTLSYLQILSCTAYFGVFKLSYLIIPINIFGDPSSITIHSLDCLIEMNDRSFYLLRTNLTNLNSPYTNKTNELTKDNQQIYFDNLSNQSPYSLTSKTTINQKQFFNNSQITLDNFQCQNISIAQKYRRRNSQDSPMSQSSKKISSFFVSKSKKDKLLNIDQSSQFKMLKKLEDSSLAVDQEPSNHYYQNNTSAKANQIAGIKVLITICNIRTAVVAKNIAIHAMIMIVARVVKMNTSMYDDEGKKCEGQCQQNDYPFEFIQLCIECQIKNCELCSFQEGLCQKCNQGWKLSNDFKYCYKTDCIDEINSYYNPQTERCTTSCSENFDKKLGVCTNLRKFSQIQAIGSRTNIQQQNIQNILYFDQVDGNPMIVTLNNSTAVLYSYEQLIPINQIELYNSYQDIFQQNQSIFLFSQSNIQKIDLQNQSILITQILKSTNQGFFFTKISIIYYLQNSVQIVNLQNNQQQDYQILNTSNIDFAPQNLNESNDNTVNTLSNSTLFQPSIKLSNDTNGCLFINQSNMQLLNPTALNLQLNQIDQVPDFVNQQQILISINQMSLIILNTFEYDDKIRFIFMNSGYYQGVFQSAIMCTNLTLNKTTNNYFLEYDEPHFAQTTQQIIEYRLFNNSSSLILATQLGYEIINVSPQLSFVQTNSSQNVNYYFNNANGLLFGHYKFLSDNQSLITKIINQNLYIQILNFNDQGFFLDEKQIKLNIQNYVQFNLNFNQVLKIDEETILMAYKNQLQKITFPSKNNNQTIQYSSFADSDSTFYQNGVQKVLYSNCTNSMIIIFDIGFRVIYLDGQLPIFERNLGKKITNVETISCSIAITYQVNESQNFLLVNLTTYQMYQYFIQSNNTYISLIKQQNPQVLIIGVYYQSLIQLFILQQQSINAFSINATPYIINQNQDSIIQILENNIYIYTQEYYILVYNYNFDSQTLQQIDNIYSKKSFFILDSNRVLVLNTCNQNDFYSVFERVKRLNYNILKSQSVSTSNFPNIYQSRQYQKFLALSQQLSIGQNKILAVDLNSYLIQTINQQGIIASNEISFVSNTNQAYLLFYYSNFTNITLSLPFSTYISSSSYSMFQALNSTYLLIQNIQNELYLFNLYNQFSVQLLLSNIPDSQLCVIQENQIAIYSSNNLKNQYLMNNIGLIFPNKSLSYASYSFNDQTSYFIVFNKQGQFIDFATNEYININIRPSSDYVTISESSKYIGNRQFLTTNRNNQYVNTLTLVNYVDCTYKTAPLQGIKFLNASIRPLPIYTFLDNDLDILIVMSQNRLNLFQYSSLSYLGSLDYNSYCINCLVFYIHFSNSLAIQQSNFQFQIFELWTLSFTSLNQNALKNYRNRFLYNQDSNTYLYFDYNTGVINTYNSSSSLIMHQFKLQDSQFATQYFVQFYKISYSRILAIISNKELVVYDFIQNQQIYYSSSSFNCVLYSNFSMDIYCLEANNVLKKFNSTTFDFEILVDQNSNLPQLREFQALTKETLFLKDQLGRMTLLDVTTLQVSSVQQVQDYLLVLTSKQFLSVYQIDKMQKVKNITEIFKYYQNGSNIQDFLVINYNISYTLVIATSLQIQVFNMQSNQLIANLPVSCQNQLKFKQDEDYLYVICIFQVSVFKKRTLKLINYYKVNQFNYSNLRDVQHVYSDKFVLTLSNEILLVKLNQNEALLLDSVQNLNNPTIYMIIFDYQKNSQNVLNSIILKCYSDSNIIDITYQFSNNNFQTNDTLLTFYQSPSSYNNTFQHKDLQSRVFFQKNLKLSKYIFSMTIQNQNLTQIEIYYDIFNENTEIEYQFQIQENLNINKGTANLIDNLFILPQFHHLTFSSIKLQVNLQQSDFNFNIYQNIKTINFNDIEFFFNDGSQSLLQLSNLELLILDEVIIKDQKIDGVFNSIVATNSGNILINNFNATNVNKINMNPSLKDQDSDVRIIQSAKQNLTISIFNFSGCQSIKMDKIMLDVLNDASVILASYYQVENELEYYNQYININNTNITNTIISEQGNNIISLQSVQGIFQNVNVYNIQSEFSLLSLSVQKIITIQNSNFELLNFRSGSAINMLNGILLLNSCTFLNINSIGFPCALNVFQADSINITKTSFTNQANLKSINTSNRNQNSQGGAIKLQNTNSTNVIQSIFHNCSAFQQGGAIFSLQTQSSTFFIQMSSFTENQSIENSGGALFLSQYTEIRIIQSNFTKNRALNSKGGAIYFESSNIKEFELINFSFNQADIGGSIFYFDTKQLFFNQNAYTKNKIKFQNNQVSFYGKNVGSFPVQIGVAQNPYINQLKVHSEFTINNIASGNYLDRTLYLNFIDEENNPLNFLGYDDSIERDDFYFLIDSSTNSQVIIQQGTVVQLNKTIGLFELNFQSVYKISQNQTIQLVSNKFQNGNQLSLSLNLHYRNCIIGETILENNHFIQCDECVEGRYSLKKPDMNLDANQIQCISCPSEANYCQGSQIQLKDGFWRENEETDEIYSCFLNSCSVGNIKSKYGCLPGFIGPLCNSCDTQKIVWGEQYGMKNKQCDKQNSQSPYLKSSNSINKQKHSANNITQDQVSFQNSMNKQNIKLNSFHDSFISSASVKQFQLSKLSKIQKKSTNQEGTAQPSILINLEDSDLVVEKEPTNINLVSNNNFEDIIPKYMFLKKKISQKK